jgi:ABC-2 type transport system ATP-binding protein
MPAAIEVHALRKSFRRPTKRPGVGGVLRQLVKPEFIEVEAVKDVSFSIQPGEFIGFLGPNGAGKTTTIKMLAGILHPTSGSVTVLGEDPWRRSPQLLRRIAMVMGNRQQLWWDLPARDSFAVLREVYDLDRTESDRRLKELVEMLGLGDKIDTQVRKLSLGERMKCEVIGALLHRPQVVFLDEPTIGLDMISQKNLREFLRHYNQQEGATVLLTSHYMQDVEELCERVLVINHGTVVYDGALARLQAEYGDRRRLRFHFQNLPEEQELLSYGEVVARDADSITLAVMGDRAAEVIGGVMAKYDVRDLKAEETDVEEVIEKLFRAPIESRPRD